MFTYHTISQKVCDVLERAFFLQSYHSKREDLIKKLISVKMCKVLLGDNV